MMPEEKAVLGCNCFVGILAAVFWGAVIYGVLHYALKYW